jgi:3-hydroxyacyl-CoA dehydrogenase
VTAAAGGRPGKAGQFAWKVLSRSLAYSARRIGEIADDVGRDR